MKIVESKEILKNLLSQIGSFDTKASILTAVIGVVFGLAAAFMMDSGLIAAISANPTMLLAYKWLFGIFCGSALISLVLMVMVIFPRRKKLEKKLNAFYYRDIDKIREQGLDLKEEIEKIDLEAQIYENARICCRKEALFRAGIFFSGLFLAFLASLIICVLIIL